MNGTVGLAIEGWIDTFDLTARIPPGVMRAGTTYFFEITACGPYQGGEPTQAIAQFPHGCGTLVTGRFIP